MAIPETLPETRLEWDNPAWAWQQYVDAFGPPDCEPERIRVYEVRRSRERGRGEYIIRWPSGHEPKRLPFTVRWSERNGLRVFRYPDDPALPGLADIADPDQALACIREYVPGVDGDQLSVRVIRYRPESRAVLRHKVGNERYYARAVRRSDFAPLVASRELVQQTRFALPETGGAWDGGCVVWEKEAAGRNLRAMLAAGEQPDIDAVLDCIESVWDLPFSDTLPPYDLLEHHRGARRTVARGAQDDDTYRELERAVKELAPFAGGWRPTGMAHNDFYDDQMVARPDGGIVMVDYDSIGPGEPMLDIGRFLAYAKHGAAKGKADGYAACYETFRAAALARYAWPEHELNLREAVCLFGLCGFPATRPGKRAMGRLQEGIGMVNELLGA
ncbi:MAG: hypothetical protein F4W95_14460 [Chloroflexi bacterium]|nr:hypothetical protein [Chloroflexota bacterium]MYD49664.1 hypothetical protein [Chloroflexota bacterium]